ncbi:hypothetical protein DXG01_010402 [Tephrocybe rancida]|nr:hypothetical protein DXG01_010402 [Tephrocybe rancida]
MKFTTFFTLASIAVASALGANVDILVADASALVDAATAFENGVSVFPTTIGVGTFSAVQDLEAPLSEADGLQVVAALDSVAQIHTRALQALEDRKDAIAALPSLGLISAVNAILQALRLVKKVADTASCNANQLLMLQGAALDAWIAIHDAAIAQLDNTILLFTLI